MLVQLETPIQTVAKAVALCNECNTRVILNPAPAADLPDEILSGTDIITPNETEAESLTGISITGEDSAGKAADRLHEKGVRTVIITLGAGGAFISDPGSGCRLMVPGFNVEALDTTAAGDVFNGQLAVAFAEGKSLEESVRLSHAAAALSVQKMGAQSSIPKREETDSFLQAELKKKS